ncbi:hypothetical protein [Brochothrix phage ADU4]|nr:hypothetical protein [Brochothrix phage ADU4]
MLLLFLKILEGVTIMLKNTDKNLLNKDIVSALGVIHIDENGVCTGLTAEDEKSLAHVHGFEYTEEKPEPKKEAPKPKEKAETKPKPKTKAKTSK